MNERFKAFPDEVAGLGRLTAEIGQQTLTSYRYFNDHGQLTGVDNGELFGSLAVTFDALRDVWRDRHVHLATNCAGLGDELNTAAWLYADQEKKNYEALNAHTDLVPVPYPDPGDADRPARGNAEPYSDCAHYGSPEGMDYPAPAHFPDDVADVIADAAGWLGDLDYAIEELIGHSPLRELIDPIGGNWNDLRRLGAAYRIAGEAMSAGGDSLAEGTSRVDEFWDGLAAVAYKDYAARQIAAMRWEGSCGRVIEAVADRAADEIRKSVFTLVTTMRERLEAQVDVSSPAKVAEFLSKKVSPLGSLYQIYKIADILYSGYTLAKKLLDDIRMVTDAFNEFLSLVASPSGYLNEQFQQKLEPITKGIHNARLVKDVYDTASAEPVYNVPKESFSVGTGRQPWEDA
jgi:hypothetical protein